MNSPMDLVFFGLAAALSLLALATVLTKHILRSAIYLMGVLCLSAGLYLMLGADFIAGTQVLVYVGGIVVVLVFAVMLTRSMDLLEDRPTLFRKVVGFTASASFFGTSAWLLRNSPLAQDHALDAGTTDIKSIGRAFLDTGSSGYVFPFEMISILLLAVLIAGIVIARKEPQS
ncbi:NADH-quinone oxidoreductase subunit J [Bdellovibrionota bacterium FG-1]